jgi:hypothetical protein
MQGFNQVLIGGYPGGGLTTDKKPMMLANEAFSNLQNAYVWRDRVKKREGSVNIGRLSLSVVTTSIGTVTFTGSPPVWTFKIFSTISPAITLAFAQIKPGTVTIVIGGTITLTDAPLGNGILTSVTPGNSGTINYITSTVTITTTAASGTAATITFFYFPSLQSMGIIKQDVATIGIDQTIFFDTTYAYQFVTGNFQRLGTATWTGPNNANGTNTFFFWGANYQGADPSFKYFFVTNNNITLGASTPYDPIRYYSTTTSDWIPLQPFLTNPSGTAIQLWQALIIVPYYGRLLMLNTWEGVASGGDPTLPATTVKHFSARCTFSQLGDPTDETNGWRRDIFGRGGFVDAPTNESIVGAAFFRNTLIIFFEYSTWQLRYIGEYGLPFIFERISSDFGAVSTFSSIIFDQGVMTVSDRGIISASAGGLKRIDEQIPETIFGFQIQNSAPDFVHGIRDFEKELVYWNYVDTSNLGIFQVFPNTTLVYNYKNDTWAQFRDTITCFGPSQFTFGITWDSLTTFWDSEVSWDNVDDQNYVEYVTFGNQQGFISIYENPDASTPIPCPINYAPSLFIYSISLSADPITIVSPLHNIQNQTESGGEIVFINGMLWSGTDPGLNGALYLAVPIDANTLALYFWNGENYVALTSPSTSTYIGGGVISLCPVMNIVGKDFNPYQAEGKQFKLSYIDFLMDTNNLYPTIPAVTIQMFVNSYVQYLTQANQLPLISNQELSNSSLKSGFIQNVSTTNPSIITSKMHSLRTGTLIYISNVIGITNINQMEFTITVINADQFSINSTSVAGAYIGGGIWNTVNAVGETYLEGTEYAWYRFYSTQFGQFLRVGMTYDNSLMNQISTHQTGVQLHAMNFYFRSGGRMVNN